MKNEKITSSLTKKREAKVQAEFAQCMDKVSILRQEIAKLERQQLMAQENFDQISRQIKKEVEHLKPVWPDENIYHQSKVAIFGVVVSICPFLKTK